MSSKNAKDLLPPKLLEEIQKYVQGERIYIPHGSEKARWGSKNGTREAMSFRNRDIVEKHNQGMALEELSALFCLSPDTLRKIIYKTK